MPMRSLVVDDARVTQLILERILGCYGECHVAKNGTQALQAFGTSLDLGQPYDLICLDMGLPDFGGLELLMKIRAIEEERNIPEPDRVRVIAVTASADTATVKAVIQMGDGYILKPIKRERLIRDIAHLGLIPLDDEEKQVVDALSRLCESDGLAIHTLADLMTQMAASISRQNAVRFGGLPQKTKAQADAGLSE
jgi:two-component system, chemotaxis family, chemotaxis protein CheY